MNLTDIPVELISHILLFAIPPDESPLPILLTSSLFYTLAIQIVHRDVRFVSLEGMERFISSSHPPAEGQGRRRRRSSQASRGGQHTHRMRPLSRVPESVEITLPGGLASRKLWSVIKDVFLRCQANNGEEGGGVRNVKFTLNSLASDPNLHLLHETLGCFNPTTFQWSGPDPDHNFSCAIVPAATSQLFLGLKTWTHLTTLHLSSISFSRCLGRSLLSLTPFTHPLLRNITLSQVVFLHPSSLAMCAIQLVGLERLHCIDCYMESIYGPRVRIGDVEREFSGSGGVGGGMGGIDPELGVMEGKKRVMNVVKCEARLERLLGGDREVA